MNENDCVWGRRNEKLKSVTLHLERQVKINEITCFFFFFHLYCVMSAHCTVGICFYLLCLLSHEGFDTSLWLANGNIFIFFEMSLIKTSLPCNMLRGRKLQIGEQIFTLRFMLYLFDMLFCKANFLVWCECFDVMF